MTIAYKPCDWALIWCQFLKSMKSNNWDIINFVGIPYLKSHFFLMFKVINNKQQATLHFSKGLDMLLYAT